MKKRKRYLFLTLSQLSTVTAVESIKETKNGF